MGVSENRGTPKSSILRGFSIINHPFWGTPIFGNIHVHHPVNFLFLCELSVPNKEGGNVSHHIRCHITSYCYRGSRGSRGCKQKAPPQKKALKIGRACPKKGNDPLFQPSIFMGWFFPLRITVGELVLSDEVSGKNVRREIRTPQSFPKLKRNTIVWLNSRSWIQFAMFEDLVQRKEMSRMSLLIYEK